MNVSYGLLQKIFGTVTTVIWIFVLSPQLYGNYRSKSDGSLSLLFIFIWLIGDSFGAIGIYLGNLALSQLVMALYCTCVDVVLIAQVLHYRRLRRQRLIRLMDNEDDESDALIQDDIVVNANSYNLLLVAIIYSTLMNLSYSFPLMLSSDVDEHVDMEMNWRNILELFFGYTSAALYLLSRLPQMYKNFLNKSCKGLSTSMFVMTLMANVCYVLSVIFDCLDNENTRDRLIANCPYLLGSGGTMIFDCMIFMQFYIYRSTRTLRIEIRGDAEDSDVMKKALLQ